MSHLPEGWTECALQEVLTAIESGSRPKGGVRGIESGIPSIGGEHLTYDGGFDFSNVKYVPDDFANKMRRGHIQENDILIVKDGATTGKTAFVTEDFPFSKAVVNEHVFLCRPLGELTPRFVFRYLTSKEGQERILANFQGAAQGGINLTFAPNTTIPLAPLAEQRRIVAKVEAVLAKVNASRERLDKIPRILKRFRQSVLSAACSGKLTTDWRKQHGVEGKDEEKTLGELITDIRYGTAKKCSLEQHGVAVLRIPNIGEGILDLADLKYAELSDKEQSTLGLQLNDILMIRSNGSVSLVGKCAIVRKEQVGMAYAGYLIRLRPNTELVNPDYLNLSLASSRLREAIELPARSTSGVNNINSKEVCALKIPYHPLPEQEEIVRRVEKLFALADTLEARYQTARAQVEKLTQSVLAKAFRGELVPTEAELARLENRDYEPASALLERIQQTRTTQPKPTRKRATKKTAKKAERKAKG